MTDTLTPGESNTHEINVSAGAHIVLHMPAVDMQRLVDEKIEGATAECIVPIDFGALRELFDKIDAMRGQLENISSVAHDCPECVELVELDELELSLSRAIDLVFHTGRLIQFLQRCKRRNRKLDWLLKLLQKRSGDSWRSVGLTELKLPDAIDQRIKNKVRTLHGLEAMNDTGSKLTDIGLSSKDAEEVLASLREVIRGMRNQYEKTGESQP